MYNFLQIGKVSEQTPAKMNESFDFFFFFSFYVGESVGGHWFMDGKTTV